MKFLQIHTFYRRYQNEFYSGHPDLGRAPFDEQIKALVENGFGAGHVFAPYMRALGYDAHFVVGNCPQAQAQWAREHDFFSVTPQNWELEIARRQVETLKPDILFLRNPLTFDSHFLRLLSWKPALIIGWQAAAIPAKTDWSLFDVIMSSSKLCLQEAAGLGARSTEYFFPGFPSWVAEACQDESQKWDVVFSGQWTRVHNRRNQLLQEVAKASSDSGRKFSCGFFIDHSPAETLPAEVSRHNQGARWGLEMFRALKSGRIVLNASGDAFQDEAPNMRLFEVTGAGAFLLTDYQNNLQQFFELGVEIETFRDKNELLEKIHYYLNHPEQREAMARRGQERCLREYPMQARAKKLDEIFRQHLARESVPSTLTTHAAQALPSQPGDSAHPFLLQQNEASNREAARVNLVVDFNDLQIGLRVKVKGTLNESGAFVAQKISVKEPEEESAIDGLIRNVDLRRNILYLLNGAVALPEVIEIKGLQHDVISAKKLKTGDRVKLKGKYSPAAGFAPEKIKLQENTGLQMEEVQGDIDKIDKEKKTLEVIGFTVRVDEKTIFL